MILNYLERENFRPEFENFGGDGAKLLGGMYTPHPPGICSTGWGKIIGWGRMYTPYAKYE